MGKKALITGITGQDGAYLSKLLLEKGYEVYGAFRRTSDLHLNRLRGLGVDREVRFVSLELLEFTNVLRTIDKVQPDEVYNLAAQSFVSFSFEQPIYTSDVTGLGPLRLLEAIRAVNPKIKFYQASSSEMFGDVRETPQRETTPFYPRSPYAIAKVMGHWATVNYRESYGIFACSGILFNHESPLRGLEFVTRKITMAVAKTRVGKQRELLLGNLESRRDWGYAPEYVEAMWLMLQQREPDDYVIATGENHSVRDFVDVAFAHIGIEISWEGSGTDEIGMNSSTGEILVRIDPKFFRPAEVNFLCGDPSKAKVKLNWSSRTNFEGLVHTMVDHDIRLAESIFGTSELDAL